jgi:hypothetical protein
MRKLLIAVCGALSLFAAPLSSKAQSSGNKAAAEAIFEQGRLLMQSGDYRQACVKFEASRKLDEGIGTLLYLADCYEKVGRTASAWATFKEAASMAGAKGQDARQKLATQRASTLEPGLVSLSIEVDRTNDTLLGFEVRNDGVAVPPAQFGAPVPIDPGEHRIEASAPGRRSFTEIVNVTSGVGHLSIPTLAALPSASDNPPAGAGTVRQSSATIAVHSTPSALGPGNAPKDTAQTNAKTQRMLSYVLGGVGLVGVGLGAFYGVSAISHDSQSKSDCPAHPNVCTDEGVALRNTALRQARISTVAFVAGAAALTGAAVLFFTTPSGDPMPVRVQSAVTTNSAEFGLGGWF